jgi:hypothetical protein
MGLAIADALVAEIGGRVRHERRADTTRFVVTLPDARNAAGAPPRSRT